jgi:ribosomal protein L32
MVLRKAQMELKDVKLNYCGSLGHQSFFDRNCSTDNTQTRTVFIPSTGLLTYDGTEYQCTAL